MYRTCKWHPISLQMPAEGTVLIHDDDIKWKHFPRYWPFVRGIHRSSVNFPHIGQWWLDDFFDPHLDKRLGKPTRRQWIEKPSRSYWRHCNEWFRTHHLYGINNVIQVTEGISLRLQPLPCVSINILCCISGFWWLTISLGPTGWTPCHVNCPLTLRK